MTKAQNKNDNFKKAVKRLNEAVAAFKSHDDDIYQDAIIKRFEFTFELAWKTLRVYLIDQGYNVPNASPKGILSFAYQEGYIENEKLWLSMLEDRNATAHDYGNELAKSIAERIANDYAKELTALSKFITAHI